MNERPSIVTPALVGGVALGITSALPLVNMINCACCALIIGGGILASFLYLRDYPPHLPPITYGDGAVLGLLTGVIGGLVWAIVELPLSFLKLQLGMGLGDLSQFEELLDDPNIPPAARELLMNLAHGGAMTLGVAIFSIFINLVVAVIFATIGAIIGVALFNKRPSYAPPSMPGPYTPPPAAPQGGME
jgi:hypothetical protein